eukprot:767885-Hanusia_phi.AAC.4
MSAAYPGSNQPYYPPPGYQVSPSFQSQVLQLTTLLFLLPPSLLIVDTFTDPPPNLALLLIMFKIRRPGTVPTPQYSYGNPPQYATYPGRPLAPNPVPGAYPQQAYPLRVPAMVSFSSFRGLQP